MRKNVYRIDEICEIKSGKRLPKNCDFAQHVTAFPYIRGRDIKNGKINTENLFFIEEDVHLKIKKYIIETDDIALTIVGSVGDVAYATDSTNGYHLTENAVRLTKFKDFVNSKYLFYVLNQRQYYNYMQLIAGAAAQPKLGIYKVERIRVELPNIYTQQRIASILSAYDDLIENNNRRIKILEQMAENLYKEWFVRFRFPGHESVKMKDGSPCGWVLSSSQTCMHRPETWHYGMFAELNRFVRGKNITSANMSNGDIPVISAGIEPSGYHNQCNVIGKSLTISSSGANAGYLKYHQSDIWAADCSYCQDEKKLWFIYNALNFLQPVIRNLQIGAAQPHVYPKHINKINTIIPDDKTIDAYCTQVEPIYQQIFILKAKNRNLTKQRDMLLPRLMSGKLEV